MELILGLGTDMIDVARVNRLISKGSSFIESVFTEGEIVYCDSKRYRAQHYAARFAAKEAFLKALGTGWRDGITFRDIELVHDELGKPSLVVSGQASVICRDRFPRGYRTHVSVAHLKDYATATVIIEEEE